MDLMSCRCVVIKVGSALLIDEQKSAVNTPWLCSLIDDIAMLINHGIQVAIVSSGAIAYGKITLGLAKQKIPVDKKQAAAALGQIKLIQIYQTLLEQQNLKAAQILLTLADSESRRSYLNLRNTLKNLLSMRIVPVINENDSIATGEIRYGDNDRLAARVAQMIDADALVLLSDIDGFYTQDPSRSKTAKLIPEVQQLTPEILAMATDSNKNYGSGGMITKLAAAKIANNSGCHMLITSGTVAHPIRQYLSSNVGTWFRATMSQPNAKKIWLRDHLNPQGTITIDAGAEQALRKGASLLPVGITTLAGKFHKGAPVKIINRDQQEVACGLSNYDYQDLQQIIGIVGSEIEAILGYDGCHEVIHRDNLAITS